MSYLALIGSPEITVAGAKQAARPRRLALLAYLALEGKQARTPLGLLLFPNLPTEEARARLRVELHRVQHSALGPMLGLGGDEVWVEAGCDLLEVRSLAAAGAWAEVLARCTAPLMHGLEFPDLPDLAEWLRLQRQAYEQMRAEAAQAQMLSLDGNGQREAALEWQRQLLLWQPFAESFCDALTRRLVALGRRTEALEEQEVFRERFVGEFGFEPELTHSLSAGAAVPSGPVPSATYSPLNPPLVGREGLLHQLNDWYAQAPAGALALLLGDGGVGKSRLAQTFAQAIAQTQGEVPILLRGRASGQQRPFSAVLEALQPAATPPVAGAEISSVLLGESYANEAKLLEACRGALLRSLPEGTRLVRIEDAHWLDASSARVLLALHKSEALKAGGLRFLLTSRPEGLLPDNPLAELLGHLSQDQYLTHLEVAPLSEVSVLKLIRLLSGSPRATAFARTLHGLSGGNAYALLAFLQGLISRDLLDTATPGGWTLHVELDNLREHLPQTLQSLLEQTVRASGEEVLTYVQAAALLGQTFDSAAAQVGSDLSEPQAEQALQTALGYGWVRPKEGQHYRLEHALLREALLKSIPADVRTPMHARLAAHLEAVGAPAAERAQHWEGAGALERALELWQEAAYADLEVWARTDALYAFERALACATEPADKIRLWRERGRVFKIIGALDACERELGYALELQAVAQVPGEDLQLAQQRLHLLQRSNRLEEALAVGQPWVDGPVIQEPEYGLLLHDHASVLIDLKYFDEAELILLRIIEQTGEQYEIAKADAYHSLVAIFLERNQPRLGLQCAEKAEFLFRQSRKSTGVIVALNDKVEMYLMLGDKCNARSNLITAIEMSQELGNYRFFRHLTLSLIDICREDGDWSTAERYATEGLEAAEAAEHTQGIREFSQLIAELSEQAVSVDIDTRV